MPEKVSKTLKVLQEIRDRVANCEQRLDVHDRQLTLLVEGQARLNTQVVVLTNEVVAVADAVRDVATLLRERLDDRQRVEDHERRIEALERKVG